MRNIYVVNEGGLDYSPAERFGTLVYCTTGSLDRFDTSLMYRLLSEAMRDSQQDDFILLTSLTSLCSIACALFGAKHKCLNLLLYKDGQYSARNLRFDNLHSDAKP